MMWMVSLVAFLLLGGYLLLMAFRKGVPCMVSDTFYQLGRLGWVFSLVMLAVAFMMLVCLLDADGIPFLAFIGCSGLAFVGVAPNYADREEYKVHKAGAVTAAVGCIGWCLGVCPWVTIVIAFLYLLCLGIIKALQGLNGIWYLRNGRFRAHPWYWAEVAGFVDVFVTYWCGC